MGAYRNPPIIEAVCEFRFSSDTPWDDNISDTLFNSIKDDFPIQESRQNARIKVKSTGKQIEPEIVIADKSIFLSRDRKNVIQIGPRLIAISCLKPYQSWEKFQPNIKYAFEIICKITDIKGINRIALLYIDKIDLPADQIDIEEYFKFYPCLGSDLPDKFVNFIVGCDFSFAKKRDMCRLKLTKAMPEIKGGSAFLLTSEYYLAKRNTVAKEDAMNWVENAHVELKRIFQGCITEKLEDYFTEVK